MHCTLLNGSLDIVTVRRRSCWRFGLPHYAASSTGQNALYGLLFAVSSVSGIVTPIIGGLIPTRDLKPRNRRRVVNRDGTLLLIDRKSRNRASCRTPGELVVGRVGICHAVGACVFGSASAGFKSRRMQATLRPVLVTIKPLS